MVGKKVLSHPFFYHYYLLTGREQELPLTEELRSESSRLFMWCLNETKTHHLYSWFGWRGGSKF